MGGAIALTLTCTEHSEGVDALVEIHRRPPLRITTRKLRSPGLTELCLFQLILRLVLFDFVGRLPFALLYSLGARTAGRHHDQRLTYPLVVKADCARLTKQFNFAFNRS